jgi:hypothetical protein
VARLCERPTCRREAGIVYGFDAERLLVWFEALKPEQTSRMQGGVLCAEHAARMTVPRGWHLEDRRQAVPALFPESGTQRRRRGEAAPAPPRPSEQSRGDETLSLFEFDTEVPEQEH